jgi:hypothetical protein
MFPRLHEAHSLFKNLRYHSIKLKSIDKESSLNRLDDC